MKNLSILFCLTFLLLSHVTKGQILNVNSVDVTTDSSHYIDGNVEFYIETDNRSPTPEESAQLLTIQGATNLVYVAEKDAHYLSGQLNYYRATGDPIISTGFLHYRINFQRKKRLSYETYMQGSFDASRRLDYRYLGGVGVKYRMLEDRKVELDVGTGFFYEHEQWETFDDISEVVKISLIKSSSYIKTNFDLTETGTLNLILFYQVGYDQDIEAFRNRISGSGSLEFSINEHFSFVISASIHYEDKPVIDINKTVYSIQNGLQYTF
ncbi:MAG: DUF481 domain-containing protein [Reichenbachiella sp.]